MHSLAAAATLLDSCDTVLAATPILESLGFDSGLIPLAGDHLDRLGIRSLIDPHLASGQGALRALAFEAGPFTELRTELNAAARSLASNAPQLLWLIVAVDPGRGETAIAALDGTGSRPRVAALVTRRGHVVDSDSETVLALAAASSSSDMLTHCRWLEILGRESVSRSFFRTLEQMVARLATSLRPPLPDNDAADVALLYVSRLLFLSFLETRGWLDRDHGFLANRFADCMVSGGRFHQRVLSPLFFGTLNTAPSNRAARAQAFGRVPFLNGGLFARSRLERATANSFFPDETLGDLFGELFSRYRFTAREDRTSWSESAIDPEMLGKAFESLMSRYDRKKSGAYYTPQSLVAGVTASAIAHALPSPSLESIDRLRILDPACGSGAFLVHVLEKLSVLRAQLGDSDPPHRIRRRILTGSIFGVDSNPMAVWLCELRLWLSMAIEDPETDPMRVTPLPNLDRNIRVGDSLSGDDFAASVVLAAGSIVKLRAHYARATGPRKRSLARALDTAEREQATRAVSARIARIRGERRELLTSARSRDLFGERTHRAPEIATRLGALRATLSAAMRELRRIQRGGALPFSFPSGFADVAAGGGFDLILGNPPWIRTHNLALSSRAALRSAFEVYRNSAWKAGSEAAAAGRGFASQVDMAALFVERSVRLLRPGGTLALIVPAKLWQSLAGGGVREFLLRTTSLLEVHDLGSGDRTFDAAVYPSVVVARREPTNESGFPPSELMRMVAHRDGTAREWLTDQGGLGLDVTPGCPWLIVPPEVRHAFDALSTAGVPLARSVTGRPLLGVKTGCHDAFIVSEGDADANGIETSMLRPVIRGASVTRWRIAPGDARIIWTHDSTGRAIARLPSGTMRWLTRHRANLESRSDARGRYRWWTLFRTEAADSSRPRVVWADIGRRPRAAVLRAGDTSVPVNSCYVLRCPSIEDACAMAAIINSDVAAAWLGIVAEPARGGYRRYMGWTMAMLPVPCDWPRARSLLAPIAARAMTSDPPDSRSLHVAVLEAYGIRESAISPLLEWDRSPRDS